MEQEFKSVGRVALSDPIGDAAFGHRRTLRVFGWRLWWPLPLVEGLHSSGAMVLGYPLYGDETPRAIRWLTHTILRPASDAIWWVKYRLLPKHQHHIVRTGLDPNYYDQDTLMLHACMACLGSYIEEEGGEVQLAAWTNELIARRNAGEENAAGQNQIEHQEEALAIWRWWKVEKPADEELREERLTSWSNGRGKTGTEARWDELQAIEKKIDDDEQAYLHRLVNIRRSLWT